MLILSRIPSQKIIIGDKGNISISILSIEDKKVKLGLVAPQDIVITRIEKNGAPAPKKRKSPLFIQIKVLSPKAHKMKE